MVVHLKQKVQELKDELSLATGEERTEELTTEEIERCCTTNLSKDWACMCYPTSSPSSPDVKSLFKHISKIPAQRLHWKLVQI